MSDGRRVPLADEQRIEEGCAVALWVVREDGGDFSDVTICLAHESAPKAFAHILEQGGFEEPKGWAELHEARSELPPEYAIPPEQLAVMISAGKLHVLVGMTKSGGLMSVRTITPRRS